MGILGRTATRLLLAGLLVSLAATILLMARDDDRFLLALLAVGGFGLLLTALPAALFLYYSRRGPALELSRQARLAIGFSGVALVLFGALLVAMGVSYESVADRVIGVAAGLLGVAAIVVRLRRTPRPVGTTRFASARSSVVGAVLFFLAAETIPKLACGCGTKDTAYRAELESDLKSLVLSQEAFFAEHHRYASRDDLEKAKEFFAGTGDSMVVVLRDSTGWYALASHVNLPWTRCGIWIGARPPDAMHGAGEGVTQCWNVKQP